MYIQTKLLKCLLLIWRPFHRDSWKWHSQGRVQSHMMRTVSGWLYAIACYRQFDPGWNFQFKSNSPKKIIFTIRTIEVYTLTDLCYSMAMKILTLKHRKLTEELSREPFSVHIFEENTWRMARLKISGNRQQCTMMVQCTCYDWIRQCWNSFESVAMSTTNSHHNRLATYL